MVFHSRYILERIEDGHDEIILPDVNITTWDLCVRFLEPMQARFMLEKDVLEVVQVYHKYEFHQGLELCDEIMKEYFSRLMEKGFDQSSVNFRTRAVVVCHENHLEKAKKEMKPLMKESLTSHSNQRPNLFTREHIETLQPWIVDFAEDDDSLIHELNPWPSSKYSKDVIKSVAFPHLYVADWYGHGKTQELISREKQFRIVQNNSSSEKTALEKLKRVLKRTEMELQSVKAEFRNSHPNDFERQRRSKQWS